MKIKPINISEEEKTRIFEESLKNQTLYIEKEPVKIQPVHRWISVKDKLPEQDEKVLVYTKDKDIMTMIYKVIPFRWYKPKFGGFDKDYVTHWKPLPEPPNQ